MNLQRVDKLLSNLSPLSRAEAKKALRGGRVTADGTVIRDPDAKVDADATQLALDGVPLRRSRGIYLMMNKPAGYVTSNEERGQATVLSLLPAMYAAFSLFAAGRLDKDTEGFLLLTNDGDFCHRVISPKAETEKCYYLQTADPLTEADVTALAAGATLRDGALCRPARMERVGEREARIYLTEGKYHEVKRLIASRGNAVTYLKRLSIGGVPLDEKLAPGEVRELTEAEITAILGKTAP